MEHKVNGGNKGNNNRNLPPSFDSFILGGTGRQVTTTHLVNICIATGSTHNGAAHVHIDILENNVPIHVSMLVKIMSSQGDRTIHNDEAEITPGDYFALDDGTSCVDFEINATFFVKTNAKYEFRFIADDGNDDHDHSHHYDENISINF